jgi:protein-tyrosine phosphatase
MFVCTGNIYRSPMAEAFFRSGVKARGLDFTVASAGLIHSDRPIAPAALSRVERADPQMAAHRAKLLRVDDVVSADLIIGMTRAHVRAVVVLVPDAWPRTFTLKELVRRGTRIGPRQTGQTLSDWLAAVGAQRSRSDLLGDSVLDDIADPVAGSTSLVRIVAREIRSSVRALIELISPTAGEEGTDPAYEPR